MSQIQLLLLRTTRKLRRFHGILFPTIRTLRVLREDPGEWWWIRRRATQRLIAYLKSWQQTRFAIVNLVLRLPSLRLVTPPASATPLDFTTLPLPAFALSLQTLAESLLMAILQEQTDLNLVAILRSQSVTWLQPTWRWPLWQRWRQVYGGLTLYEALRLLVSDLLHQILARQRGFAYPYLVAQTREGILPPIAFYARTLDQVEHTLGRINAQGIPDTLLPLASDISWRDLRFQQRIAEEIFTHLRQNQLLTPYQQAYGFLTPQTYWLLILLTETCSDGYTQWLSPTFWRTWWAAQRLRQEANRQVQTDGWADFWDQWVLHKVAQQRPQLVNRLDPTLRQQLLQLPLLQFVKTGCLADQLMNTSSTNTSSATGAGEAGKAKTETLQIANPAWAQSMPPWFRQRYQVQSGSSSEGQER